MTRRLAAAAATISGVLACGGVAVAASAAAGIVTTAAASTAAGAINVRPGDLQSSGAWKAYAAQPRSSLHQYDAREAKCYGGQYASVLADVASKAFSKGADSIVSDVEVFRTTALAAADFKAFGSPARLELLDAAAAPESFAGGHAVEGQHRVDPLARGRNQRDLRRAGDAPVRELERQAPGTGVRHRPDRVPGGAGRGQPVGVGRPNPARPQTPPASLERTLTTLLVARAKSALG